MDDSRFKMTEPAAHGEDETYAFWLTTPQPRLFAYVKGLRCVRSVEMVDERTAYVVIDHAYDADEVWHYICAELEEEAQFVELDQIWQDAIWLL